MFVLDLEYVVKAKFTKAITRQNKFYLANVASSNSVNTTVL